MRHVRWSRAVTGTMKGELLSLHANDQGSFGKTAREFLCTFLSSSVK